MFIRVVNGGDFKSVIYTLKAKFKKYQNKSYCTNGFKENKSLFNQRF